MFLKMKQQWQSLRPTLRKRLSLSIKLVVTILVCALLLRIQVDAGDGTRIALYKAIGQLLQNVEPGLFWPMLALAMLLKLVGICASLTRWHLLLIGQGLRFPFFHLMGSFLVGRFLGIVTPSTVGLDGYTLYDAARFTGKPVRAATAKVVEKVLGGAGLFLTYIVVFPFGMALFGENAEAVAWSTLPVAMGIVLVVMAMLTFPGPALALVKRLPLPKKGKIGSFFSKVIEAAQAYQGHKRLLLGTLVLSFVVHLSTAAMYYPTAIAVGAVVDMGKVVLASSVQILGTVLIPLSISGTGPREALQAALLSHEIGAAAAAISGTLGLLAGESLSLFGAWFWLRRPANYCPRSVKVDGEEYEPNTAPDEKPASVAQNSESPDSKQEKSQDQPPE